jgi:hypothetical protein
MKVHYSTIETELSSRGPRVRLVEGEILARPPCCLPPVCAFCGAKPAHLPGGVRNLGSNGRVHYLLCPRHDRMQRLIRWGALLGLLIVYPAITLLTLSYERQLRIRTGIDLAAWVVAGVPVLLFVPYYYGILFISSSPTGESGWVRMYLRNRAASEAMKTAVREMK